MNMIFIDGAPNILVGLGDIPDMIFDLNSAEPLEDGNFRVGALATDDAIAEIQSRGATVGILEDNDAVAARLDELYTLIDASEPPVA
jgi:hypothetical protein